MAKVLGLEKAVIMRKILGWIKFNMKNHKDLHEPYPTYREGKYWVYNSLMEWEADIQVMKKDRIHRHLRALEEEKWLITGNFNKRSWDKTVWYTIEFIKFFGSFPHLGSIASKRAVGNCDDPSQNATAHLEMRRPLANCDDNTNKQNPISKTNNPEDIYMSSPQRDHSGDITLYEGHPSLDSSQKEQKHTASELESSTPKKAAQKNQKTLKSTWEPTDAFAAVFENLNKLSICRVKFDTEDYRQWLTAMMESDSLTIPELIRLSNEWQEYHNERTQKPKVVKASFRTWITNYVARRAKNGQQPKFAKAANARPDYSADNGKFKNTRDDKPW